MGNDQTTRPKALLLSCMDLRFIDETAWLMNELGLHNNYDHVAIAGAALGVLTKADPAGNELGFFGEGFWKHVELARLLHGVKEVIIVEHRGCGAYHAFVGGKLAEGSAKPTEPALVKLPKQPSGDDLPRERAQHLWYAGELARQIKERTAGHADGPLTVRSYLIAAPPTDELQVNG